ncbi:MAG: alpha/beta hydrolase [Proteobacteria bacterium]|nr:MAG: alpha/beta hydrolase [Pseudomonadota bacterium]
MPQDAPTNLGNGHIETLLPYLFRPVKQQAYQRERIDTPDGDFLDLDWVKAGRRKLLIISHGLESSSKAKYVQGIADHFRQHGFDILAWNYRGCSGEINKTVRYYHSGATEDLEAVLSYVLRGGYYHAIYLVGFSLGGNLTLKYLGEQAGQLDERIKAACAFSTPCCLKSASHQLATGFSRLYTRNFVNTLKQKVYAKREMLIQHGFDFSVVENLNSLPEFDQVFTGPVHGFRGADDYYDQCSARYFIESIKIPTLIVNAANDPFLSEACYPYEEVGKNPLVHLEVPPHGGHVGFYQYGLANIMWSEARALRFMQNLV